jgi:hypothetical protein
VSRNRELVGHVATQGSSSDPCSVERLSMPTQESLPNISGTIVAIFELGKIVLSLILEVRQNYYFLRK